MRIAFNLLVVSLIGFAAGCAGPEQKFGRGLRNVTEFVRLGELSRSIEQTALWDGPEVGYTTGFIRGFNRSLARTGIGAYEIITTPLPPYGPVFTPKGNHFPDVTVKNSRYPWGGMVLTENRVDAASYRPGLVADSIFATDTSLGFTGGDVVPIVPGSRFRIFDN